MNLGLVAGLVTKVIEASENLEDNETARKQSEDEVKKLQLEQETMKQQNKHEIVMSVVDALKPAVSKLAEGAAESIVNSAGARNEIYQDVIEVESNVEQFEHIEEYDKAALLEDTSVDKKSTIEEYCLKALSFSQFLRDTVVLSVHSMDVTCLASKREYIKYLKQVCEELDLESNIGQGIVYNVKAIDGFLESFFKKFSAKIPDYINSKTSGIERFMLHDNATIELPMNEESTKTSPYSFYQYFEEYIMDAIISVTAFLNKHEGVDILAEYENGLQMLNDSIPKAKYMYVFVDLLDAITDTLNSGMYSISEIEILNGMVSNYPVSYDGEIAEKYADALWRQYDYPYLMAFCCDSSGNIWKESECGELLVTGCEKNETIDIWVSIVDSDTNNIQVEIDQDNKIITHVYDSSNVEYEKAFECSIEEVDEIPEFIEQRMSSEAYSLDYKMMKLKVQRLSSELGLPTIRLCLNESGEVYSSAINFL